MVEPSHTLSAEDAFSCPICRQRYSRVEHLQRHLDSHSSMRPFTCQHCGKSYRRKDVLMRHLLSCKPGAQGERSKAHRPARPSNRRACDRCVKQKRACSCTKPCENCAAQNRPCTYPPQVSMHCKQTDSATVEKDSSQGSSDGTQDVQNGHARRDSMDISNDPSQSQIILNTESDQSIAWMQSDQEQQALQFQEFILGFPADTVNQTLPDFTQQPENVEPSVSKDRDPANRFKWLIQFTRNKGLTETFEFGQLAQLFQQTGIGQPNGALQPSTLEPQPASSDQEGHTNGTLDFVGDWTAGTQHPTSLASFDDPLSMKTMEICTAIKRLMLTKPQNLSFSLEWSPVAEGMAQRFFCPANIRRFMEIYWDLWYPHWPVIHRPSFRYHSTPPTLLAALVLIGASLSPRPADNENAHVWYDIIEELVFSDKYASGALMGGDDYGTSNEEERYAKVQTLQAAHAVCCYQYWEGSEPARCRVRRFRASILVAIMRELGPANARHQDMIGLDEYSFDWQEFSRKEEMIRIMMYVFLLDAAFVTWNNFPPRVVIRELGMSIAYPESCFQAQSASECVTKINDWHSMFPPRREESLYSVIQTFCSGKIAPEDQARFAYAGLLTLWAVVKSFLVMVFHLDPTIGSGAQFVPVLDGIANWKAVWNQRISNADDDTFDIPLADNETGSFRLCMSEVGRRLGFFRHCAEYWLLARLVVTRRIARQGDGLSPPDEYSSTAATWLSNLEPSPFDGYDQSRMVKMCNFLRAQENLL